MPTKKQTAKTNGKNRVYTRLHARAKHHYYRVMPDKKHHRTMVWAVFFVVAGVIAAQLLYPADRALPFAYIDGQRITWQQENELMTEAEERFQATRLKLIIEGGSPKEYSLAAAGAHIEADRLTQELTEYPFWQRYVPFSMLIPRQYHSHDSIHFTSSIMETFAVKAANDISYAPQDARLRIKDGTLEAYKEKSGRTVDAKVLADYISEHAVANGTTTVMNVPSRSVAPKTTADSLKDVRVQAERALAIPLTLTAGETTFTPTASDRASWLVLGEDEATKTVLRFDAKAFNVYLAKLDTQVGVPAGQTQITLVNGHETARKTGESGRTVDMEAVRAIVEPHVIEGIGANTIELPFRPTTPQIIYNESYTATQEGLRAFVQDAAQRYNSAIAIQQVGGNGWSAEARADVSMPSASTYKLYVAKMLFDAMDRGEVGWNDPMQDTTVSGCFDRMTIASTNACAEEWIRKFGRTNINTTLYGLGLSRGTTFTHPEAAHTTARDLRTFLLGVNNGSIIDGAHRDRLLHSLSVHSFRRGVPAGSGGQVQDKVGFLWDYTHDAAIVRHPRGTYVIVVMTKGQSYARIAAITREVEKIMYP